MAVTATVLTVEVPKAVEGVGVGGVPGSVTDILVYPRRQCCV